MSMGHVYESYFQVSCTKLSELVGRAMQVLLLFCPRPILLLRLNYLAEIKQAIFGSLAISNINKDSHSQSDEGGLK
jgi:hypothetical protein